MSLTYLCWTGLYSPPTPDKIIKDNFRALFSNTIWLDRKSFKLIAQGHKWLMTKKNLTIKPKSQFSSIKGEYNCYDFSTLK